MTKLRKFAFAASMALLLSGCATTSPPPILPALKTGTARLVVFREPGLTAALAGPSIYVNGHEIGKLYPKSYVDASLEPGTYEVKSEGNFFNWPGPARVMRVELKDGKTTFLQLMVLTGGGPAIVNHYYEHRTDDQVAKVVETLDRATKP